ncbi:hypothetical protein JHK85_002112 [Glycine max]|nr:hypothetical protein JHK85_002112 [Glycine max]KAG5089443.1 hypothetical protein JHK86_002055 [Glycine max]
MKEGFYLLGLEKSSPTFAAAMQNSCRYESVHFNRIDGLAKVLGGVLASVGGASIITLYKGPVIYTPHLGLHQEQYLSTLGDATGKNWNLGGIYLFGHSLCWSGWIFLTNAAFFEKDYKAWQFNSSREICSVLFSVGTGDFRAGISNTDMDYWQRRASSCFNLSTFTNITL